LSLKGANSPTRGRKLRSTGTKAGTRVASSGDSQAALIRELKAHARDLEKKLEARTHELAEAREQQTSTSEVLRVISSSSGGLEPVFKTILDNAVRVCGAKFGNLGCAMATISVSLRRTARRPHTAISCAANRWSAPTRE
jgi:hypothetical protein